MKIHLTTSDDPVLGVTLLILSAFNTRTEKVSHIISLLIILNCFSDRVMTSESSDWLSVHVRLNCCHNILTFWHEIANDLHVCLILMSYLGDWGSPLWKRGVEFSPCSSQKQENWYKKTKNVFTSSFSDLLSDMSHNSAALGWEGETNQQIHPVFVAHLLLCRQQ